MRYWTTYRTGDTTRSEAAGCWCHHIETKDHGSRWRCSKNRLLKVDRLIHHSERNHRGQQEAAAEKSLPLYDSGCYLCPGNTRAQGDVNPTYNSTFTFVNDYSAVKEDQKEYVVPDRDGSVLPRSPSPIPDF